MCPSLSQLLVQWYPIDRPNVALVRVFARWILANATKQSVLYVTSFKKPVYLVSFMWCVVSNWRKMWPMNGLDKWVTNYFRLCYPLFCCWFCSFLSVGVQTWLSCSLLWGLYFLWFSPASICSFSFPNGPSISKIIWECNFQNCVPENFKILQRLLREPVPDPQL